jgi:predicted lipid carrier protein YhbT
VVRFLTDEWFDALADATDEHEASREPSAGHLVIQQTVRDAPAGDVTYHVVVEDGRVSVRVAEALEADVSFVTDYATAVAISRGEQSAQVAFLRGQLKVGGDVAALSRHAEVLARIDDVFAEVRPRTEY